MKRCFYSLSTVATFVVGAIFFATSNSNAQETAQNQTRENPTQNLVANGSLPRATPESVGIPSDALTKWIRFLDENVSRIDSLTVLRDGKVVSECWRPPHSADAPHALYSLSKSFTSTAIGFAVAEGKLKIDQKIVDIFPDETPVDASEYLKQITLADLLSMSCGHDVEVALPNLLSAVYGRYPTPTNEGGTWVEAFLAHPVPNEPGTIFKYNTPGTYMLSATLQKTVGETTRDYLVPRLFEPLHIETPYWEQSPQGISKGGTGLYLKSEDVAKFGQFYLQRGVWNGKQLLPADWIDLATSWKISNGSDPKSDWAQGYCFQFWRCQHDAYRGDGAYGQLCVVLPKENVVVVMTADSNDFQKQMNTIWDILLPAFSDAPLDENPDALATLRETEKSLTPKEGVSGSQVLKQTIYSQSLKRDVEYTIYLPNEYRTTSFSYPVLYLLHGAGGSEDVWFDAKQGNAQAIADAWFAANPLKKSIIVSPDAGNSWYRDSADDSSLYETFFFDELIPEIEKTFRCKTGKENRLISGLSMGGYGALLYALRRPDAFSGCYAMSPAIRTREEVAALPFGEFVSRYRSKADVAETDARFDEYFDANDPHILVKNVAEDQKGAVRFLVDCGDDDYLTPGAYAFHLEAKEAKVPCEFRVRNGAHTWEYWREALPLALDFLLKN